MNARRRSRLNIVSSQLHEGAKLSVEVAATVRAIYEDAQQRAKKELARLPSIEDLIDDLETALDEEHLHGRRAVSVKRINFFTHALDQLNEASEDLDLETFLNGDLLRLDELHERLSSTAKAIDDALS